MRKFSLLYRELDQSTRINDKVASLVDYFKTADRSSAAWALWVLTGHKVPRVANSRELKEWIAEYANLATWLIDESYDTVGDLAETLTLLIGPRTVASSQTLESTIQEFSARAKSDPESRKRWIFSIWDSLSSEELFLFHKLVTGSFRVGVAEGLIYRALAECAGVEPEVIAARMSGIWKPVPEFLEKLFRRELGVGDTSSQPFPFYLAYPLDGDLATLGPETEWCAEWKWDGIRGQIVQRQNAFAIWSRGQELVTDRFPELAAAGRSLPIGTVLDGEIIAWRDGPLPFFDLQKRIGRKSVSASLMSKTPVSFIAYDLLEANGNDIRTKTFAERRSILENLVENCSASIITSPLLSFSTWSDLANQRAEARSRNVEGIMLKRRDSAYGSGRKKGDWWKWKLDPFSIDAVLVYAQKGHGRRADLFTDYTFAVWKDGELVPVAKAYSGLTDEEIKRVDSFIRANTIDRFGPVRVVEATQVFEIAFEGVQLSPRHKSGLAVRFPRILRWREDKPASEADSIDSVKALLAAGSSA